MFTGLPLWIHKKHWWGGSGELTAEWQWDLGDSDMVCIGNKETHNPNKNFKQAQEAVSSYVLGFGFISSDFWYLNIRCEPELIQHWVERKHFQSSVPA